MGRTWTDEQRRKLAGRRKRIIPDYSFSREIDVFFDEDTIRDGIRALERLTKESPQLSNKPLKDIIPILYSRLSDIAIEREDGCEWKDYLADFKYKEYANKLINRAINSIMDDFQPLVRARDKYPDWGRRSVCNGEFGHYAKINEIQYYCESIDDPSDYDYGYSKIDRARFNKLVEELDRYFPKWRNAKELFVPSNYLQGCLIKHFRNGPVIKDTHKIHSLATKNLISLIEKEFITQFNLISDESTK